MAYSSKRQVFKLVEGKDAGTLVEITSCEDRGDYWYISFKPIYILDGKHLPYVMGFGATRVKKNGPKPERQSIFVDEAPRYGVGARVAWTVK
jgi:hypothetical protein